MGSLEYIINGFVRAIELLLAQDPETYSAIGATLWVSTLSMALSLLIGIPLGFLLGHFDFPGKRPLRTTVDTLLAFPTVVIGLLVYAFISRRGPLGDLGLLFTLPGMALGQTILALPIVIALTATAVESLDQRLSATLRSLGASRRQAALTTLWEARYAVMAAAVTAYGRVVSEVGISMMVGGNIKWHTRTITTAIALETGKGEFSLGIALGLVLMILAFLVNLGLGRLKRRLN
ncbi:ABC transporter permease [Dethiosulfatarculus sandiegensis]|uniref:ABC transporter permease n=1 Tax=Dethiosulfatarculus sandiegensis TaxID=1429043 RepID=A0A0D2J812_9BACT|nr:ABC transporter permease [Dethiosulfatarculus sandiegensis]KIX11856.1 ABC transporter permease [Dethiosulfatarculus sandiegensis]